MFTKVKTMSKVEKKLSKNCQKVTKKLSKSCQKVVTKSCHKKLSKVVKKSCSIVEKGWKMEEAQRKLDQVATSSHLVKNEIRKGQE
jgi:hypothetical protein